jgi:hypothetical protein
MKSDMAARHGSFSSGARFNFDAPSSRECFGTISNTKQKGQACRQGQDRQSQNARALKVNGVSLLDPWMPYVLIFTQTLPTSRTDFECWPEMQASRHVNMLRSRTASRASMLNLQAGVLRGGMTDDPQNRVKSKKNEKLERAARIGIVRAQLEDALRELDNLGLSLAAAQLALVLDKLPSDSGKPIQ